MLTSEMLSLLQSEQLSPSLYCLTLLSAVATLLPTLLARESAAATGTGAAAATAGGDSTVESIALCLESLLYICEPVNRVKQVRMSICIS